MPLHEENKEIIEKLAARGALNSEVGGIGVARIKAKMLTGNPNDPPLAIVFIEGVTSSKGTVAAAIGREAIMHTIAELEKCLAID